MEMGEKAKQAACVTLKSTAHAHCTCDTVDIWNVEAGQGCTPPFLQCFAVEAEEQELQHLSW